MSFQPKKKYDIEMQTLQTLSQKLASKMPNLADYACNLNADKLAMLDIYIQALAEEDPEFVEELKTTRQELKLTGEALWIMNADVLTNLGLKVGRTGIREGVEGKRAKPDAK